MKFTKTLIILLNYSGQDDVINSINQINKKKIKPNKTNFEKNLLLNSVPNPDILIRTGNTKRLSNFLFWQLAYAEIFFVKKLWPAFNEKDYNKIINEYKNIKRNFGKI